jgi:hypothetical protein
VSSVDERTSSPDEPLTEAEQLQLTRLLSNPLFFPQVFENWISDLTRTQVTPQLPFSQVLRSDTLAGGVFLFSAVSPTYPANGTWKDCGTVSVPGPCDAVVFFMGSSFNWSGDEGYLALSVNGSAASNNERLAYRGESGRRVFGARAQYVTFPLDVNTLKYQCIKNGSGDVDFQDLAIAIFRIFKAA